MDDLNRVTSLLRERRFVAAIALCDKILGSAPSSAVRADALLKKAQATAEEDGRWSGPTVLCLSQALDLTPEGSEARAKVLVAFTAAYATLGSLGYVMQYRHDFQKLLGPCPSRRMLYYQAQVEYNMAVAIHQLEDLEKAIEWYGVARRAYEKMPEPRPEGFLFELGVSLLDAYQAMGDFETAKTIMDDLFPQLPEEEYGAIVRLRHAEYALHQNDPAAALLWVESGLGHQSCDLRTRAALTLTRAKIALQNGQIADAHDIGLEAMRLAALSHRTHLCDRVACFLKSVSRGGI